MRAPIISSPLPCNIGWEEMKKPLAGKEEEEEEGRAVERTSFPPSLPPSLSSKFSLSPPTD